MRMEDFAIYKNEHVEKVVTTGVEIQAFGASRERCGNRPPVTRLAGPAGWLPRRGRVAGRLTTFTNSDSFASLEVSCTIVPDCRERRPRHGRSTNIEAWHFDAAADNCVTAGSRYPATETRFSGGSSVLSRSPAKACYMRDTDVVKR